MSKGAFLKLLPPLQNKDIAYVEFENAENSIYQEFQFGLISREQVSEKLSDLFKNFNLKKEGKQK